MVSDASEPLQELRNLQQTSEERVGEERPERVPDDDHLKYKKVSGSLRGCV